MSDYKDVYDMITDVWELVNVPSVTTLLGPGAKVEPIEKSTGPTVKGIVINGLSISNTADQVGFGNVNCYAPAIVSTVNGNKVSLADQPTLSTLAKAVKPLIDGIYKPTFRVWVESLPAIIQDTDGSYFANMTFRYQSIQDNFKRV